MRPLLGQSIALLTACLCLWLVPVAAPWAAADATPQTDAGETLKVLRENLEQERLALAQVLEEVEEQARAWDAAAAALEGAEVGAERVAEARLAAESAAVRLEMVGLDIAALEQEAQRLREQLARLAEAANVTEPPGPEGSPTPPATERQRQGLQQTAQLLDDLSGVLETRREALNQLQQLAETRLASLEAAHNRQARALEKERLEVREQRLNERRNEWLAQAAQWRKELGALGQGADAQARGALLETRVRAADEQAQLVQLQVQLARLQHRLALDQTAAVTPEAIEARMAELEEGVRQLAAWQGLLERKRRLLLQQQELVQRRQSLSDAPGSAGAEQQEILAETAKAIAEVRSRLHDTEDTLSAERAELDQVHRESLRTSLTRRNTLPIGEAEWQLLRADLAAWPQRAKEKLLRLTQAAQERLRYAQGGLWINWALFSLLWIAAWRRIGLGARHYSYKNSGVSHENIFAARTLAGVSAWWRRNRGGLLGWGLAVIAGWMLAPGELAAGLSLLAGYWLWLRVIGGLSYMLLASPLVEEGVRHPHLHRTLYNLAAAGGFLGTLLLLGQTGFMPQSLLILVERLLLAFLLLPGLFLLRTRGLLLSYADESLIRPSWREAIHLLSFAIPLAFFAAGVLGFAGYLNLGWRVAGHLGWFILVLFGWLVVRGLSLDLTNFSKGYVNAHTTRGLLWAQEVIDPLHRLFRLLLFLGALFLLAEIYGWTDDPDVAAVVGSWLATSVVNFGGMNLRLEQLLWGLAVLVLVFRFAGWLKQISYRWVFQGIADIGIRNSLAVFTQYTVVLVGLLVALNALGLDLTSLAVFAGALGVGIGFGLQTIANNFISGIILLAERPLRAGDWVSVAENMGEVSRIGIRSVTVTTWDNQDVIIPNSEFVSHSFTNWTLSNSVVRIKTMIRVAFDADPRRVQHILQQAIRSHPAVVEHPSADVWLYEYGDSALDFWVHVYIDVMQYGYLETRSQVLMAIWDALRENGIHIPFPQQDIHVRDLPQHPASGMIVGA